MGKRFTMLVLLMVCIGIFVPALAFPAVTELHFFFAENCPGCREQKPFVEELQQRYPELKVRIYDVWLEHDSYELMMALARARGVEIATTPATAVGRHAWFGFNDMIAEEIEAAVADCAAKGCPDLVAALAAGRPIPPPVDEAADAPLPLDLEEYSLPVFTVLLGLLDSFNPCAFFVLLFLLSLMAHTRSRRRMFLVGGVFIFFSGLVYFLFMAAWLNLFLLAGQLPLLTAFAGLLALAIALLNIKDHFFFHHGPSLSISEKAKPKLMARMRNLLKGHRLLPILGGTVILALVANSYELLCTAGFPMVYTRVLTLQELPGWLYYLYLGLYNLAYVTPLLIIASLFALTLGSRKMSEFEGRVLKLMSGMMMLILGLILLWDPMLLQNLQAVIAFMLAALLGTGVILLTERWVRERRKLR
ncbi:MAG: thioredoxin family protein [Syntrophotaleaceae bacterium]